MIIKSFETKKINLNKDNFVLLYGKNEGLKNHILENLLQDKKNISGYEEKDILNKNQRTAYIEVIRVVKHIK